MIGMPSGKSSESAPQFMEKEQQAQSPSTDRAPIIGGFKAGG
ncbi:hypothetical protein [Mesorhizobium sp. M1403]